MSFTEDELQAFNSILEQRFAAHRQEMEQALDQRLSTFRHDVDQQLTSFREETTETLKQWLANWQGQPGADLAEKLNEQQTRISHAVNQEAEQKALQVEATVDRMLAAQLLGIEQLLNRYVSQRMLDGGVLDHGLPSQLEAIEVQTELPWEDLAVVIGKALDERLSAFSTTLQRSVKNLEQYLAVQLHSLRDELARTQGHGQPYSTPAGNGTSVQEVLSGIEHLERVMESMQVAMSANHALLSNRLYHHQQLPLERAHPAGFAHAAPANGGGSLLARAKERVASGLEPEISVSQETTEETERQ
jgi:hypothetical protein